MGNSGRYSKYSWERADITPKKLADLRGQPEYLEDQITDASELVTLENIRWLRERLLQRGTSALEIVTGEVGRLDSFLFIESVPDPDEPTPAGRHQKLRISRGQKYRRPRSSKAPRRW